LLRNLFQCYYEIDPFAEQSEKICDFSPETLAGVRHDDSKGDEKSNMNMGGITIRRSYTAQEYIWGVDLRCISRDVSQDPKKD
jgi:hypothetical protein